MATKPIPIPPTHRQAQALDFVSNYQRKHRGVSPTFVEIGEALNITSQAAHGLMVYAAKRGLVTMTRGHRTIRLTEKRELA